MVLKKSSQQLQSRMLHRLTSHRHNSGLSFANAELLNLIDLRLRPSCRAHLWTDMSVADFSKQDEQSRSQSLLARGK